MDHLHDLVEGYSTITSSTTGFDYKNDNYHEDDYIMSSFLVFDPQEFVWSPSNAISIFGADDKAKSGCVLYVAISATDSQSVRTTVSEGKVRRASDHDFNTVHLIPSLTHVINITSGAGYSIYSGGEE